MCIRDSPRTARRGASGTDPDGGTHACRPDHTDHRCGTAIPTDHAEPGQRCTGRSLTVAEHWPDPVRVRWRRAPVEGSMTADRVVRTPSCRPPGTGHAARSPGPTPAAGW